MWKTSGDFKDRILPAAGACGRVLLNDGADLVFFGTTVENQ